MIVSIDLSAEMVERIDRFTQKFPTPPSYAEFTRWLIDVGLHSLESRATELRRSNNNDVATQKAAPCLLSQ